MTIGYEARKAFQRAGFIEKDTEYRLIALAKLGNQQAVADLIKAYTPFIRNKAARHNSQLPLEDRMQIATLAFTNSIRGFNPALGYRISTIAAFRIRRDLDDAGMLAASRLNLGNSKVRRTVHQNVLRACSKLGIDPEYRLTDEEVDQVLELMPNIGVTDSDIRAALETGDAAFSSIHCGCDGRVAMDIPDEYDAAELVEIRDENLKRLEILDKAIEELDELDQQIIRECVLPEKPVSVSSVLKRHRSSKTSAQARQDAVDALTVEVRYLGGVFGLLDDADDGPAGSTISGPDLPVGDAIDLCVVGEGDAVQTVED